MQRQSASDRIRTQIILALEERGPKSRASLAADLGISRSTASVAVADLIADGVVENLIEPDQTGRRIGRPGARITLRVNNSYLIGVDFGRLTLKVGLFDSQFQLVDSIDQAFSVDVPAVEAVERTASQVRVLLERQNIPAEKVDAVTIGVPGPVDAMTGELHAGSILAKWVGTDVTGELERRLGIRVFMENDANLGILAESRIGGAQGASVALYVLLSVGVGLGIALDGTVFRGVRGIAGELGHVVTDEHGPLCRCGSRGCLEAQISVNALAGAMSTVHGPVTPDQMLQLAATGDLGARRIVSDAAALAGKAVGALCNYFNPDTVIVAGELVRAGPMVLEAIRDAMGRVSLPRAIEDVDLRFGQLGENAELYGAAYFGRQRLLRESSTTASRAGQAMTAGG